MHLAVIFENIGGYHAARLRSAAAACAARDWKFTAIQITATQTEHPWGAMNEAATPFPVITVSDSSSTSSATARKTSAVLDEIAPDAVAIPGWGFGYSRAALRWCKRHRARAILMSESKRNDEPRSGWKEFLKSWLYVRHFNAGLVGDTAHRDYLVRLGLIREKIFTGYDVVDNQYFAAAAKVARDDPERARHRQPMIPHRPYFLAVTRLIPRKNVLRLITAYAKYREQSSSPWDLVICGSGSGEAPMNDLIGEKQLAQCVHLPGFVRYQDIGDFYGLASVFIHPALQEQWGLVVNEAMASGLPVLVSNTCGCFSELARFAGFGFDPRDEDALATLMQQISNEHRDRAALGRAAIEQAEKFSPAHFGVGLLQAVSAAA